MVRRHDLDERVERVGAAEGLVGGGDRRIDHRPRVDEVAEVDDARDALGVVPADEKVAGVGVPVDRGERDKRERRLDDFLVAVEGTLDEPAAFRLEVGELGTELGQPGDVPEQGAVREWVGEPGERLVETRHGGTDRAARGRELQGRAARRRRR